MERNKLSMVLDWPYPLNQRELGRFLGYLNFYRKFIAGFSRLASPLTTLTQEKVDMVSGLKSATCLTAFLVLKDHFCTAPLLRHFDFSRPRVLYVDSSKYALLVVLSQADNQGVLHPVSFLSKKWSKKQASWQCHDQELGVVFQAFIEWRTWLIDTPGPVEVYSDHANLKYFASNQHLSDWQT
jgi:hypothetical protein